MRFRKELVKITWICLVHTAYLILSGLKYHFLVYTKIYLNFPHFVRKQSYISFPVSLS